MPGHFNAPPGWPVPSGWEPPPDWEPDPTWPAAPAGWEFWLADAPTQHRPAPPTVPPPYIADPREREEPLPQTAPGPPTPNRNLVPVAIGGAVVAVLALIAVLVVIVVNHRSGTTATEHTADSPWTPVPTTSAQPANQVLDGTYRVDLNFAERQINGVLSPSENRTAWWAYRSVCLPAGCVATATMLDADLRQNTGTPASTDVFRFIGDHWEDPPTPYPGQVSCPQGGTAAVTMVGHSSWYPQADGSFQGLQVASVQTPVCGVQGEAFRVPFTATRIGDVPPDVVVADPATVG